MHRTITRLAIAAAATGAITAGTATAANADVTKTFLINPTCTTISTGMTGPHTTQVICKDANHPGQLFLRAGVWCFPANVCRYYYVPYRTA